MSVAALLALASASARRGAPSVARCAAAAGPTASGAPFFGLRCTAAARAASSRAASDAHPPAGKPGVSYTPWSQLTLGVPREITAGERRVALAPAAVAASMKKGFRRVLVQQGAGQAASFADDEYAAAGATVLPSAAEVLGAADVVAKVRRSLHVRAWCSRPQAHVGRARRRSSTSTSAGRCAPPRRVLRPMHLDGRRWRGGGARSWLGPERAPRLASASAPSSPAASSCGRGALCRPSRPPEE